MAASGVLLLVSDQLFEEGANLFVLQHFAALNLREALLYFAKEPFVVSHKRSTASCTSDCASRPS